MTGDRLTAVYEIETPVGLDSAAQAMAGEQSTGTFIKLAAETDALLDRAAARVERIETLGTSEQEALPTRLKAERYERGRVTLSWPVSNFGPSLPNLMATIAGNLFEMAQVSAIRLVGLDIPAAFAQSQPGPAQGAVRTRALAGVPEGPVIGTIIKPSVGLSVEDTAELVDSLIAADIDFIKDDELQANGPGNPLMDRAKAVMDVVNRHADRTGRKAMYAFNVSGEIDDMARHTEALERLGASCVMLSLNWVGLAGLRFLRDRTDLPIHGHRNGWGLYSRSPNIGISYPVMQAIWRMAGADHLHVNGLSNKFNETDEVVIEAARAVQAELPGTERAPMPVFSSGQTVWQVARTFDVLGNADLLLCAGGGIMSHPEGPGAGVRSLRQAAEAAAACVPVETYAKERPELAAALEHFRR